MTNGITNGKSTGQIALDNLDKLEKRQNFKMNEFKKDCQHFKDSKFYPLEKKMNDMDKDFTNKLGRIDTKANINIFIFALSMVGFLLKVFKVI